MTYADPIEIETSRRIPVEELDEKSTASGSSVQEKLKKVSKDLNPLWRHYLGTEVAFEAAVREMINKLLSGISGAQDIDEPWLDEPRAELKEFLTLGSDWDGHGAKATSPRACVHAWRFLRALPNQIRGFEPYPEPDGRVGFEYHKNNKSLYLSFDADGDIAYVVVFRKPGGEEVHRGRGVKAGKVIPASIRRILNAVA